MNDNDKQQLARLKALESNEKKQKEKNDFQKIQQIVNSCVFHYTNAGTLVGMLKNTSKENPFIPNRSLEKYAFFLSYFCYFYSKNQALNNITSYRNKHSLTIC